MSNGIVVPILEPTTPSTVGVKCLPEFTKRKVIRGIGQINAFLEQVQVYCETGTMETARMPVMYRVTTIRVAKRKFVTFAVHEINKLSNELRKHTLF